MGENRGRMTRFELFLHRDFIPLHGWYLEFLRPEKRKDWRARFGFG